jgi:replication fork protection complex subunit Tof1/Swi1
MDEVIEISSRSQSPDIDRREILKPAISQVVHALGGLETVPGSSEPTYVLGDSCLGCLRDLKKFWRKDDTDDDRTVARIFWETRVLNNDLVPILLETAGKGKVEDKCAIACGMWQFAPTERLALIVLFAQPI